jgi:hypothetical protein
MGTFDKPREGIHSIRIFDIAIIDVIFTLIAAYLISKKNILAVFIILVVLSIVIHTMFNIKTKTNSWLI